MDEFRNRKKQGADFRKSNKFVHDLDGRLEEAEGNLRSSHEIYENILSEYNQETDERKTAILNLYLKRANILVTADAALIGALQKLRDEYASDSLNV